MNFQMYFPIQPQDCLKYYLALTESGYQLTLSITLVYFLFKFVGLSL